MSEKLDIQIGLDTQRPDIQIGMINKLKDIGIDLSSSGWDRFMAKMEVRTTEEWNTRISYVPEAGRIIVYSDRSVVDGQNVPGIKIADGKAYVVDLPFVGEDIEKVLLDHIHDVEAHITSEERQFWNNKLNYEIDEHEETLTLNRL